MNGTEQSDSPIVPRKLANKAARAAAEPMEGSGGTKRNAELQSTVRTQSRAAVSQAQGRIREAVTRNRKERLTALLHHAGTDCLRWAFFNLKKRAAPGIDEVTWDQYAENLEANLADLHARVNAGTYRALPSRRKYIPKADGRQRPLGIAAIEDKIVQAAVVAILTPIYEAEFLGFSYGFRPGRGQHDALDALAYGIRARKINWILDADIRSFFDTISPRVAGTVHRASDWRSKDHPPDPEMVEGGCVGRGPVDRDNGGYSSGGSGITAAGQRVPSLRLRSLGAAVAQTACDRRHDCREIRRRHHCGLPAPA